MVVVVVDLPDAVFAGVEFDADDEDCDDVNKTGSDGRSCAGRIHDTLMSVMLLCNELTWISISWFLSCSKFQRDATISLGG